MALALTFFASIAQPAESCYQFSLESSNTGWFSTPEDALDGMVNYCRASDANASNCQGSIGNCNAPGAYACTFAVSGCVLLDPFPAYFCTYYYTLTNTVFPFDTGVHWRSFTPIESRIKPGSCEFFAGRNAPDNNEPQSCAAGAPAGHAPSLFSDPINPSNGAVVKTEGDCSARARGSPSFSRYYDSTDSSATNISRGWHGAYSRRVAKTADIAAPRSVAIGDPNYSSTYSDPATACTSGFAQIQAGVPSWVGATAQYVGGICQVVKNGAVIGTVPLYSSGGMPVPLSVPTIYRVIRDDGQAIRFWQQNGVLRGSAGVSVRLQTTAGGFEVRDNNDNVEAYNSAGVLLSITSRSGIVQTMTYQTDGPLKPLIAVTDSFGHSLTFSYDGLRIKSVTRQ